MKRSVLSTVSVLILWGLAPAHTGMPPIIPDVFLSAPATIATTGDIDVTGTTWCSQAIQSYRLKATKNGAAVNLTFNSITTQTPHAGHTDHIFNVDLDSMGLSSGDVVVWTYHVKVNGTWYFTSAQSVVQ
jgi:hypothetical protein